MLAVYMADKRWDVCDVTGYCMFGADAGFCTRVPGSGFQMAVPLKAPTHDSDQLKSAPFEHPQEESCSRLSDGGSAS